ncbi:MAG: hypothetical protein ACRCW2_10655 [Cellulosilyticaceae bacterium]
MHPRTGLETPYLSNVFMEMVTHCVEEAKVNNMLAWLYDEDRWPSGFAGGLVTKNLAYRARHLLFTPQPYAGDVSYEADGDSAARGRRTGKGTLIATYAVDLDAEGYLKSYRYLRSDEQGLGIIWYAYLEVAEPSAWFNNQTYVDTLNPEAIQAFITLTYERYKQYISEEFGQTIPAIFTDEPQFTHKVILDFPHQQKDLILPWTDDLPYTYEKNYGENLLEKLPEIFWERGQDQISLTRYRYHDHIAERFASAFADQCGKWCEAHELLLTGHMMEEPTLHSQTAALGEAMRSYRSFGLPGIDMLCDSREYNTAKQAQSAARQFGRPGVLSELYGVTNWDFDFRGHKLQGDWQAAMGVTVRVPHLAWVSMKGEAKRDYPASIGYQSPWYKEYGVIENHFARLNTVLTQGNPVVKIGVIHPIETYWLYFGPHTQMEQLQVEKEDQFEKLTQWLLFNQLDFDWICESLLPEQCTVGGNPLCVGKMQYDAILVPECLTLRKTTYERLVAFEQAGGKLIFLGSTPRYMDARLNQEVKELYKRCKKIAFTESAVTKALEAQRDVKVTGENGQYTSSLLYQLREDDQYKWLFVCQGRPPRDSDECNGELVHIGVKGQYKLVLYDTLTGSIQPYESYYDKGYTYMMYMLYSHTSLLVRLEGEKKIVPVGSGQVEITLEEPNVCLLDQAAYRIDDAPYEPEEEILRLDNKCRAKLGYPPRGGQVAQPWTMPEEVIHHRVTLKFTFESECDWSEIYLATESAEDTQVWLNGEMVEATCEGWFVDHAIQKIRLPQVRRGMNFLEVSYPFGKRTHLEWCYLLGAFGVSVYGNQKVLTALPRTIQFGDVSCQGFPFYGGNIVYKFPVEITVPRMKIHIPYYRGALLEVKLDGRFMGQIIFAPYELMIDDVSPGRHQLEVKLFGTRVNTFGPVHNCNKNWKWFGPDAWRSEGESWSNGYSLKPVGILHTPKIEEGNKCFLLKKD